MSYCSITSARLVSGTSESAGWTFTTAVAKALFRVGSGKSCNWRIQARGVLPNHFMLLWDGASLTLIDVGAGVVRVNGQVLRGTAVICTGRIEFGEAAIVVDSEGADGVIWQGVPTSRSGPNDLTLGPTPSRALDDAPTEVMPAEVVPGELRCSTPTLRIDNVDALVAELESRPDDKVVRPGARAGSIEWKRPKAPLTVAASPRSLGGGAPEQPGSGRGKGAVAAGGPRLAATRLVGRAEPLAPAPPPPVPRGRQRRVRPASLMLAALLVAAVCVLVALGGRESGAQPADVAATSGLPRDGGLGTDAGPAVTASAPPPPVEPLLEVPVPVNWVDSDDPLTKAHCDGERRHCQPRTLERVASDLVATGAYRQARKRYVRLAARADDPRFRAMVEILGELESTWEEEDAQ